MTEPTTTPVAVTPLKRHALITGKDRSLASLTLLSSFAAEPKISTMHPTMESQLYVVGLTGRVNCTTANTSHRSTATHA